MPKTLFTGSGNSGVDITYVKSTKTLYIGGWYDSCVGMESKSMSLADFFKELGITEQDCKKAFGGKKESAKEQRKRLGFPELTPEQERRNLDDNLNALEAEK